MGLGFRLGRPERTRGGLIAFPCIRADGREAGFPIVAHPVSAVVDAVNAGLALTGEVTEYLVDGTRHQIHKSIWLDVPGGGRR